MTRKYNIALIPKSNNDAIVKCAQKFSTTSDQYQLGSHALPHVTLCQFEADENEIDISLEFKNFSYITFNNTIFWISLIPDQRSVLDKMHQTVSNAINLTINKFYDPHMTLISTTDTEYKKKAGDVTKSYDSITDIFILSMGECDAIGQFTKLIYRIE
jgi:hypothetical protein